MTVPLNVKAINACKGLITEHAAYFRMKQLRYQAMAETQSCCEMGHRAGTDYMLRGTECSIEALCVPDHSLLAPAAAATCQTDRDWRVCRSFWKIGTVRQRHVSQTGCLQKYCQRLYQMCSNGGGKKKLNLWTMKCVCFLHVNSQLQCQCDSGLLS